jgi:hypothetical protein
MNSFDENFHLDIREIQPSQALEAKLITSQAKNFTPGSIDTLDFPYDFD